MCRLVTHLMCCPNVKYIVRLTYFDSSDITANTYSDSEDLLDTIRKADVFAVPLRTV